MSTHRSTRSRLVGAAFPLLLAMVVGLAPVSPVWAEGAASVSGHVTREGGDAADAGVAVHQTGCGETCYVASVQTTADGSYVLDGLDDGDYVLEVGDNTSDGYASQARPFTIAAASLTDVDVTLYRELQCDVSITGTYRVGQTLAADRVVTPADAEYVVDATNTSWAASDEGDASSPSDIPGATSPTYTLTPDELGMQMSYYERISAPNRGSTYCRSSAVDSSPVVEAALVVAAPLTPVPAVVASAVPVAGGPVVTGRARKGRTVVAGVGSPPAGTVVSYQWLRISTSRARKHKVTRVTAIAGATGASYRLTRRDVGRAVCVQVTFTKAGFTPTVLRSSPTRVR